MSDLAAIWLAYYVAVMAGLCAYGGHRLALARRWRCGRDARPPNPARLAAPPRVTVQLPMFNEPAVAAGVIEAAGALDWPRDRLQVQVLDDSTDATAATARAACRRLADAGVDIEYLHRAERRGYKAGALARGLETATGEFVAVFDADFVPPPDFLRRTVPRFGDPAVGMVQARWAHRNRDDSLLTRIQALSLDAHFSIEQSVRSGTGRWFNFNGTAGIWRRRAIDEAGGWRHETLTEDTDLSYRAQLAGWRFEFLPDLACPAEVPPTIAALVTQQHRWNTGLSQNAIALLPRILRSDAPRATKLEAWFHLTSTVPYALVLGLALLVGLAALLPEGAAVRGTTTFLLGAACLGLGTGAASIYLLLGQRALGRPMLPAARLLPALMAVGVGVSVVNTRGLLEALFGRPGPFVRTPKYAGGALAARDPAAVHRRPDGVVELLLGALMLAGAARAVVVPAVLPMLPFLLLFAAGFVVVGWSRLVGAGRGRTTARRRDEGDERPALTRA